MPANRIWDPNTIVYKIFINLKVFISYYIHCYSPSNIFKLLLKCTTYIVIDIVIGTIYCLLLYLYEMTVDWWIYACEKPQKITKKINDYNQ